MINDDATNEADEGFLLRIETERQTTDEIVLQRGGLALVTIIDDDRKFFFCMRHNIVVKFDCICCLSLCNCSRLD